MGKRNASWWTQVVQDRLIALVLAMVVIVPLVAAPADGSTHGLAAFAVEGFAIVLLATLLWRARWDLRRERISAFLRTGANLPVLLFLGLAVLSCAFSPFKALGAQETLRLGSGVLLYFVVAYQFRRSEQLAKLVDTLLFVAIGASLYGFAQYSTRELTQAVGPLGNHQTYGSFLMILLPIVAVVAITEKSTNRQLAAQIATVLTASALLLAHARSAWLGAAAGLALLGLLTAFTAWQSNRLTTRKHTLVLPLMLVVGAGFFLTLWPHSDTILERGATLGHATTDPTFAGRFRAWQGAIKMIRERPLTGFGIGQYANYQKHYSGVGQWLPKINYRPSLGEQAHNVYLQTAADMGLPGLALFVAILVTFLVAGLRRLGAMEPGIRRSLLMGAMAAVVAFAVDGIASPSWQFGQVSIFLWLALGLGVSCLRPLSKQREPAPAPTLAPRITRPAAAFASLALAALLPTVAFAAGPDCYAISADIEPKNATIRGGQVLQYSLIVTCIDGTTMDVSENPNTTFSRSNGVGNMTGPNLRFYQSRFNENDTPIIKGVYSYTDPVLGTSTVSDTTPLNVHFP